MEKVNHPNWENNINDKTKKLIIGSMPPKFVVDKDLNKMNIYYFYGSKYNKFWDICNIVTKDKSIEFNDENDCIKFIKNINIGIIDLYKSCIYKDNNASDNNLLSDDIVDIYRILKKYPNINKIYCTSIYVKDKLKEYIKNIETFKYDKNTRTGSIKLKDLNEMELIVLYSPTNRVYNRFINDKDKKEKYLKNYKDLIEM